MRKVLFWILPLALLAACTQTLPEDVENAAATAAVEQEPDLVPGTVILQVSEELADQLSSGALQTKSSALNGVFDGLGVVKVERLYPDAGEWEPRHRAAGLHRWFIVNYDPSASPATKAVGDFSAVEGVEFAEPERRVRSTVFFDDPYAPRQWALYNDGTLGNNYKAGCDINVEPVWANFTGGSSNVIVAVVDEGIQMDHPDLAAITIPAGENGSRSFVNDLPVYTIYPDDHGTHVAGAIAAVSNNGIGISGIAGGLDGQGGVRILACPMMHENPNDPENPYQGNARNAIVWAADHGAVICNNSWGTVYKNQEDAMAGSVGSSGPAIDYFIRYAGCDAEGNQLPGSPMKGGLVVFAAGNEGWQMGWPAAYEPVVAVGAVSAQFTRAYYSNYGDWVDICAPGGDAKQGTLIVSTVTEGGYEYYQGTSMACPQVAGVAALIVSQYGGPGYTVDMLKERLFGGANKNAVSEAYQIGPLVDALGAFTYEGTIPPEPVESVSVSVRSNTITLSWEVTADPDDKKAHGYLALGAKDASLLEGIDPRKIPAAVVTTSVTVGSLAVGDPIFATLSGLEFDTDYYTTVIAYDYAGNYSAASAVKRVRTDKNNPPVVETDYKGDFKVKPFATLSLSYTVSDPDGHVFTVDVDPGSDAFVADVGPEGVNVTIYGNRVPHGVYTAHIVATDVYGEKTDCPVVYEILENHPPKVVSEIGNLQFGAAGETSTIDLSQYFQDEDGEPLSYSVSLTEQNVAHLNPNEGKIYLTTLGYGLTTATVTATDACKASCSLSFMVLVRDETRPVDLYPNPVTTTLNIRPGTEGQFEIAVSNKAGATVWSGSSAAGPFSPVAVDMSAQPGGTYYVRIEGNGVNDVFTIAKK